MSVQELSKAYNPKDVEDKWYSWWESNHLFHAVVNKDKTPYTIVIPPPNITGILTMGHVLNNTLQDIFVRWKRMQGFEACWIPGTDHAGIATQNAVEKSLAKEGKHRHDLGREKFIELVWQWREKYGSTIIRQLRKLGVSCDWERERFTMDEGLSNAVKEVFIRLFDKGLIYRGKYIVNWCPQHQTALSDDEVDHSESIGNLYYIKYPIVGSDENAIIATTRPETMLGDTALCVHPKDERYKHLIGKTAILPIVGRKLPIIADDYIDLSFGTGVMKVTPAHDTNDFLLGQRHELPQLNIFNETAHLNSSVPKEYEGMDRFDCRTQLIKDLEAKNFLLKVEPYVHNIGKCYRCHTIIEPWLSDQWFVKMKPLAVPALRVVYEGKVQFHPDRWAKVYEHWMTNIRDWCISRQIWWGHRIPVYYAPDGNYVPARNEEEARKKLGIAANVPIRQDEDVLDTWFSSWLWPFSTLGWPEDNADLHYFNPTNTLVTAPDIIFFWVARMIMANMEFMKGTPGRDGKPRKKDDDLIPFRDVYFTSIIRDEQGRKMSKSLGNSPDPLDVIEQYGADALRFTIAYLSPLGQDVLFASEKCDFGRNFANKIWNAGRFLLMNKQEIIGNSNVSLDTMPVENLDLADRWILSRLNHAIKSFNASLDQFHVNEATKLIYDFIWHDFCDWYVEMVKTRFYGDEPKEMKTIAVIRALWIFDQALRLLHPVMPFISEELWQNLSDRKGQSLVRAVFPNVNEHYINQTVEDELNFIIKVVEAVRNIRGELNVAPSKQIEVHMHLHGELGEKLAINANYVQGLLNYIDRLCRAKTVPTWARESEKFERPKASASAVVDGTEIFVPLEGIIDLDAEKMRLEKEIQRRSEQSRLSVTKLLNSQFAKKSPEFVLRRESQKTVNFSQDQFKLLNNYDSIIGDWNKNKFNLEELIQSRSKRFPYSSNESKLYEFENLIKRIAGIDVQPNSKLEEISLNIIRMRALFEKQEQANLQVDNRNDWRKAIGLIDIVNKLLAIRQNPEIEKLAPLMLNFLANSEIVQNVWSPSTDQAANLIFELLTASIVLQFGKNIVLEPRTGGKSPDIVFDYRGIRWGIECKTIHSESPKTFRELINRATEQLSNADIDHGFVFINFRTKIDHDSFWPILGKEENSNELIYGVYQNEEAAFKNLFVQGDNILYESIKEFGGYDEMRSALTKHSKIVPAILGYYNTIAQVVVGNDMPLTNLRMLKLIPFQELGRDIIGFAGTMNEALHDQLIKEGA